MTPMPSKYEAASFLCPCTSSSHGGSTRPLQGAWAMKGNGTILKEFHRLDCRREVIRCRNLWLYSRGKFLLRHFHLLLSVPHHICPVPSTLSILAAILTTSSVPFPLHSHCITIALPARSQFVPATCSLFSYSVSPCYSTLQSSPSPNYAFFLKFSFANLHFNFPSFFHCSKLPFFPPSLRLCSSSQLWPPLFSEQAASTPCPLNALKEAGAGNTPALRAQSCTAAAQGTTTGRFSSAQSWRKAPGQSKLLRNQMMTSKSHSTKFRLHLSETTTGWISAYLAVKISSMPLTQALLPQHISSLSKILG